MSIEGLTREIETSNAKSETKNLLNLVRFRNTDEYMIKNKPFKWDYEGWSSAFTQVSNLIRHKRIHTGDKPYKCDKWNKSFASGSNLKQHRNTHNSFKKRKVFKCEFWGEEESKNYLYQTSLRKHMQIAHKEEYEKLWKELEVDKSPIIRSKHGKVFWIDLVDRKNSIDQKSSRKRSHDSADVLEEKKQENHKEEIKINSNQLLAIPARPITRQLSRENSIVRQSSILSEVSQSFNIAELLEKTAHKNPQLNQDSFRFNCPSKNSSFRAYSKNNSFMMGHIFHQDSAFLKQANDRFFDEIDDDVSITKQHGKHPYFAFYFLQTTRIIRILVLIIIVMWCVGDFCFVWQFSINSPNFVQLRGITNSALKNTRHLSGCPVWSWKSSHPFYSNPSIRPAGGASKCPSRLSEIISILISTSITQTQV